MKRRSFVYGCLVTPLFLAGCQHADNSSPISESPDSDVDALEGIPRDSLPSTIPEDNNRMYGIIGQMKATEGNREKLIEILLNGTKDMPGCKLYAIAADTSDVVSIWITEIWDSEESHQASLQLPSVQSAIASGKPMIAGFGDRHIVTPFGGLGIDTQ